LIIGDLSGFKIYPICIPNNESWYYADFLNVRASGTYSYHYDINDQRSMFFTTLAIPLKVGCKIHVEPFYSETVELGHPKYIHINYRGQLILNEM
jgi:hypothetical protein